MKVLIVDDNSAARTTMRIALKRDHEVLEAENGVEALEQLAQKPDLILLDHNMPEKNGDEFLDTLERDPAYADYRNIPVVSIGDAPPGSLERYQEKIPKGIMPDDLKALVEKYATPQ
ncbi:MAG: response regulator [Candidatus Woesearchaeota archaeon]|nr:response regulator [Candidatus Woesearchaeota archaeon]